MKKQLLLFSLLITFFSPMCAADPANNESNQLYLSGLQIRKDAHKRQLIEKLKQKLLLIDQQIAYTERSSESDENRELHLSGLRFRKETLQKQLQALQKQ